MGKRGRLGRIVLRDGPDPIDVEVGRRLREIRRRAGISQVELGAAMGLSFQSIQKYEHGLNRLSGSRLFKAANALGCRISNFFEASDGGAAAMDDRFFSDDERALMHAFRQIQDKAIREALFQFVLQIGPAKLLDRRGRPTNKPRATPSDR
jgi:transcriptional regulator with XRE-family HTH domain